MTDDWQDISTAPMLTDILVTVTYSVPVYEEGDDCWETVQWVDFQTDDGWWGWFPFMAWIPLPPTHWQPLPQPPKDKP